MIGEVIGCRSKTDPLLQRAAGLIFGKTSIINISLGCIIDSGYRRQNGAITVKKGRLKMDELIKKIQNFRNERDWDQYHSPKNLAMALVVESAELAEHFQWLTQEQSLSLSEEQLSSVKDEIGVVMIYLANLADKLGIDPLAAAHDKIEKNLQKYPADIVKGRSDKYSDYQKL